jgi:hypothetical protein
VCFAPGHSGGPAFFILTSRWTNELLAIGGFSGSRRRQLANRYVQVADIPPDKRHKAILDNSNETYFISFTFHLCRK